MILKKIINTLNLIKIRANGSKLLIYSHKYVFVILLALAL